MKCGTFIIIADYAVKLDDTDNPPRAKRRGAGYIWCEID